MGHIQNACPDNLLNLLKTKSQNINHESNDQMEDIDGDLMLSDNDSDISTPDTQESYAWGDLASYTLVEPTTREQRREAHLAASEKNSQETKVIESSPEAISSNSTSLILSPQPASSSIVSIHALQKSLPINPQPPKENFTSSTTNLQPFGESYPDQEVTNKRTAGRPKGVTKKVMLERKAATTQTINKNQSQPPASTAYTKEKTTYSPSSSISTKNQQEHPLTGASMWR